MWARCLLSIAWSGVYWPTAVQRSPCFVKPQQAQDKQSVSSLPAHRKFTSVCTITLLISLPPVIIPFSMVVCGVGLVRGSVCEGCDHQLVRVYNCKPFVCNYIELLKKNLEESSQRHHFQYVVGLCFDWSWERRQRRIPNRIDDGIFQSQHSDERVEDLYRRIYFATVDSAIVFLAQR
jgi:hypothetical protein